MHINATPHVQSELVHLTEPSTGGCRPASRCHAHHTAKDVAPGLWFVVVSRVRAARGRSLWTCMEGSAVLTGLPSEV